jgi:hypothetical protein
MSITRNNHYVPHWYQEGFFEPGRSSLAYVDLTPDRKVLADGRVIVQRGAWEETPTSIAFRQQDLYSTFFGTSANDEDERRLFGDIDNRGSKADHLVLQYVAHPGLPDPWPRPSYAFPSGGSAPSCCIREKRFATPQTSA